MMPAAVAGEDGDVGAFAFAGPFTTQPITATLIGRDFLLELLADVLHELEQVDLDPAAGGAGDQLRADALAQAEAVEQLEAVLHFVDGSLA
jgi:hypothetical protein